MISKSFARLFSSRPNSSGAWINRHRSDLYVRQSIVDNYRSRGAYKLLQINKKYPFLEPGQIVLDCGAAPGGWTQVATDMVNASPDYAHILSAIARQNADISVNNQNIVRTIEKMSDKKCGVVIAVDLLPIQPVAGAVILRGDFRESKTIDSILKYLPNRKINVILSDMAPNMSGQREADHWNSMLLCKTVLDAGRRLHLEKGGSILFKIMQGGGEIEFRTKLIHLFSDVRFVKPDASRKESKEIFLLCRGYL